MFLVLSQKEFFLEAQFALLFVMWDGNILYPNLLYPVLNTCDV